MKGGFVVSEMLREGAFVGLVGKSGEVVRGEVVRMEKGVAKVMFNLRDVGVGMREVNVEEEVWQWALPGWFTRADD